MDLDAQGAFSFPESEEPSSTTGAEKGGPDAPAKRPSLYILDA